MRKQTLYIADDGEEFETAKECREYEEAKNYNPVMLDDDLRTARDFGDASFVLVRDPADLDLLGRYVELYGYGMDGINAPGAWWYDPGKSTHVLINEMIAYFQKAKRVMEELKPTHENV